MIPGAGVRQSLHRRAAGQPARRVRLRRNDAAATTPMADSSAPPRHHPEPWVGTTVTVVTGVAFPGSVAIVVGAATASRVIATCDVSPAVTVTVEAASAYGASLVTVTGYVPGARFAKVNVVGETAAELTAAPTVWQTSHPHRPAYLSGTSPPSDVIRVTAADPGVSDVVGATVGAVVATVVAVDGTTVRLGTVVGTTVSVAAISVGLGTTVRTVVAVSVGTMVAVFVGTVVAGLGRKLIEDGQCPTNSSWPGPPEEKSSPAI